MNLELAWDFPRMKRIQFSVKKFTQLTGCLQFSHFNKLILFKTDLFMVHFSLQRKKVSVIYCVKQIHIVLFFNISRFKKQCFPEKEHSAKAWFENLAKWFLSDSLLKRYKTCRMLFFKISNFFNGDITDSLLQKGTTLGEIPFNYCFFFLTVYMRSVLLIWSR